MNRVRTAFNNFMNHERYSRFTLQTEQDGERRGDLKLSEDGLDGDAEANAGGSPTFRPAPRGVNRRKVFYLFLAALLIFIVGYMVAYLTHRKPKVPPVCENNTVYRVVYKDSPVLPEEPQPGMSWADITKLLESKLSSDAFTKTLSDFAVNGKLTSLSAGSPEDTSLGNAIYNEFKELAMEPWFDVHFVRLQTQDQKKPNSVTFQSKTYTPKGYLAYSATGRAQGKLVNANYGRPEDFQYLTSRNVEVNGSVVMMRCGKISFAQKVYNAEQRGAVGVLIYTDSTAYHADTEIYGHVHFGSGDPYTPGFPSFNQTQFPPTKSSGLPNIPAQTLPASTAKEILQTIAGPDADSDFGGSLGGNKNITLEVNNVLDFKEIHNVFGVIKGLTDPDEYVVLGAQRDAWGNGYSRATVGTSALVELARAVRGMVKDGFKPRRSIVFASWSAGEYGNVGATEWLEAYMASLDKNVFTYISLDGIVQGIGSFYASASPLLYTLLENTVKSVKSPTGSGSVYDMGKTNLFRPMSTDDPAYPFLASSGIPSISFHFTSPNKEEYALYNTLLDSKDHLDYEAGQKTSQVTVSAAQVAGQMALRLVHDHMIMFDVTRYKRVVKSTVFSIKNRINELKKSGKLADVSTQWLDRARGSFERAANNLNGDISNTDKNDPEACRLLNERMMRIEHSLLSPYVSPVDTPYRHLLFGQGPHTFSSISEMTDMDELHTQLALATWNLQGCANAMSENVWDIDNEI